LALKIEKYPTTKYIYVQLYTQTNTVARYIFLFKYKLSVT